MSPAHQRNLMAWISGIIAALCWILYKDPAAAIFLVVFHLARKKDDAIDEYAEGKEDGLREGLKAADHILHSKEEK